jgi:dienelactone hydrolase
MGLYEKWMYAWETKLTTRDTNRIERPLEWGVEWTRPWPVVNGLYPADPAGLSSAESERFFEQVNSAIIERSGQFFGYETPKDFRLESRLPGLFPTNVRQREQQEKLGRLAEEGKLQPVDFLRFTSAVRTPYSENDQVNARWFPAVRKDGTRPREAIVVLPQWNADAFSHNSLCSIANRFGVSALRLSKPYHDIRRPAEIERSDYAVSANIGRTIDACRQAVIDIRCCLDWLEQQGYERFGVLGTSLGSCYAFIAAAHDPRLQVCAFNHASTYFGDVVWTGQSTRHIRAALEKEMTREQLRKVWLAISPPAYGDKFRAMDKVRPKKVLVMYAKYDLTFLPEFSRQVVEMFEHSQIDHTVRAMPCGHYTLGETPYKFMAGWNLGYFIYRSFKELREAFPFSQSEARAAQPASTAAQQSRGF